MAPVEEDAVGTEVPGPEHRHGRVDTEAPGLIGARGDHAASAGAAHDDRLAGQFGVVEQLHGREERVHVDVQDRRDELHRAIDGHRVLAGQGPMYRRRKPSA